MQNTTHSCSSKILEVIPMQRTTKLSLKSVRWLMLACVLTSASAQAPPNSELPAALQNPALLKEDFGEYARLIHFIRQAGVKKQRNQIGAIIKALQPDMLTAAVRVDRTRYGREHLQLASLLALARIGDPAAIPQLKQVESHLDDYFRTQLLPVVIARLKTEGMVPSPRTSEAWQKKVEFFLCEAQVLMEDASKAIEGYYDSWTRIHSGWVVLSAPREVVALRQLAEMAAEAYANGVQDAFQVFEPIRAHLELNKPPYAKDPILWVRLQLGQRPSFEQRAGWLLERLLADDVITIVDDYWVQALADEGEVAVPLVCARLDSLVASGNRNIDKRIRLLMRALRCIATPSAMSCLERYADGADEAIAEKARSYLSNPGSRLVGYPFISAAWW